MATKKKDQSDGKKRYIALRRIASRQGDEIWNAGAEMWLDDTKAALYLAKGIVQPADETKAPDITPKTVTIHEVGEATDGNASSSISDA